MDDQTTKEIWRMVETNLAELETGLRPRRRLREETQMAVGMLLECHPAEVLRCVHASSLPARAVISWLTHEGGCQGLAENAAALKDEWERQYPEAGGLIPSPEPVGDRAARP